MGYSKSKRAIRKVESYLQQMVSAVGEIQFADDNPSELAYRIREGYNAARNFALADNQQPVEPYASYQALGAKFIIRVKGNAVICEPRDMLPSFRPKESLGQVNIPDVVDTLGVLGAAIMHKAPLMVFPDATSETVDPSRINTWAKSNGYFLVVSDSHVTLTKNDPGALAWRP